MTQAELAAEFAAPTRQRTAPVDAPTIATCRDCGWTRVDMLIPCSCARYVHERQTGHQVEARVIP